MFSAKDFTTLAIILMSFLVNMSKAQMIADFSDTDTFVEWLIVNDGVMGGESSGNFTIHDDGYGLFSGYVSLANNGGFTSVRYRFDPMPVRPDSQLFIRLRGDNKPYQLRIKPDVNYDYAYTTRFMVVDQWQTIHIPLSRLVPTFRGKSLDQANFNHAQIAEIGFLIANKTAEQFRLSIDWIRIE